MSFGIFNQVHSLTTSFDNEGEQGEFSVTFRATKAGKLSEMLHVSSQITKAEAGNVTLFAFDKDQELSEHTAPFDALVHVLDGETEINISGRAYHLKAGDAIIMPADEPHAVKALTRFKMLLTMIRK